MIRLAHRPVAAALAAATLLAPVAVGQCELQKVLASDGNRKDNFGFSVAISGDRAIVGARSHDFVVPNGGALYVFQRTGSIWVQEAKLFAPAATPVAGLGWSVDLEGDMAVAGAQKQFFDDVDTGAVYVFQREASGWVQTQMLQRGTFFAYFGFSVSLDGDTLMVGAPGDDTGPGATGAAYVYEWDGFQWVDTDKLVAQDNDFGDQFGFAVEVHGDRAVIGAPKDDEVAFDAGAAYVYERGGTDWAQIQKLTNPTGAVGDELGAAVEVEGDVLMVAAPRRDAAGNDSGLVHVYERGPTVWSEVSPISPALAGEGQWFGNSITLDGPLVLIGAPHVSYTRFAGSGRVHAFFDIGSSWVELYHLEPTDGRPHDRFGWAQDFDGDLALVGSYWDDDGEVEVGSAYIWSLSGQGCPSLYAVPNQISLDEGGEQHMVLDAGPTHGSKPYFMLGTTAGDSPGIPVDAVQLPLNPDGPGGYFLWTLSHPNAPRLGGSLGLLNAQGKASATFTLPPGLQPALAGLVLHHAYLVYDVPGSGLADFASVAQPLLFTP